MQGVPVLVPGIGGLRRVLDRWESKDNIVYYCTLLFFNMTGVMGDRHGHLS